MGTISEIAISSAEAQRISKLLMDASATLKESKVLNEVDNRTTLTANGRAKQVINNINSVRKTVGGFLEVDAKNMNTIYALLNKTDNDIRIGLGE
jgi:type VII secretion effector (TIGR04197 family)